MPNTLEPARAEHQTIRRAGQSLNRAWLASFLGLAISLIIFLLLARQEGQRDNAEFQRQVTTYLGSLQERRNGSEDLLRTLRALFFQNPKLGRQLFTNAVLDLEIRMDGVQAIGWAPRVTSAGRSAFEQQVRREGFSGFQIVQDDITHQPYEKPTVAPDRPEYYPLLFIEPMAGNEVAMGYDLASHPAVQDLLLRTHDAGGADVSGPIRIPYKRTVKIGILAAMPVYFPEFVPASREDRIKQNQGYVIAVVIIDELMRAITQRTPHLQLDVMLSDSTNPEADAFMGASIQGKELPPETVLNSVQFRDRPHYAQQVNVGARKLVFDFRRSNGWNRSLSQWVPVSALCIGFLLTGLVALAVRSSGEKARQVEAMVHIRTAELARANAKLKAEVSERIQAQSQLAREHTLLSTLLNRLPDAVHVTDRQGNYVLANDAHARLLGEADPAGFVSKPVHEVGPATLADALAAGADAVIDSGKALLAQEFNGSQPGDQALSLEISKLPLRDDRGVVDGLLVISHDVTHLRRAEAEKREFQRRLQETQKLESLGILAGGIAHDFNNLLTVILGNANLARSGVSPSSNARECLNRIETTSLRAADLCKQMLAYSGKGLFVVRRLDLSKLVEQTTELLQMSISKKAALQLELIPSLPPVLADAIQLQQILMNLVINASDAIGTRDGLIRVRSGLVQVDRTVSRGFSPPTDLPEGEYVFLEVSDNGCGMSPEVRDRIFDPFFSTKFTGRGLGLAAVLGIVRGHGGAITVASAPGQGSTFTLFLPPAEGPVDEALPPLEPNQAWKGHGTILLVEDEEAVRMTTAGLLEAGGFTVELAENGRSAIQKFRDEPSRYQAVLLDLTMPNGDGEEAFHEIRRIRPDAQVLIMSGFSPQEVMDRFAGKKLNAFIQKPFLAKHLMATLRQVLEVPPVSPAGCPQPSVRD